MTAPVILATGCGQLLGGDSSVQSIGWLQTTELDGKLKREQIDLVEVQTRKRLDPIQALAQGVAVPVSVRAVSLELRRLARYSSSVTTSWLPRRASSGRQLANGVEIFGIVTRFVFGEVHEISVCPKLGVGHRAAARAQCRRHPARVRRLAKRRPRRRRRRTGDRCGRLPATRSSPGGATAHLCPRVGQPPRPIPRQQTSHVPARHVAKGSGDQPMER